MTSSCASATGLENRNGEQSKLTLSETTVTNYCASANDQEMFNGLLKGVTVSRLTLPDDANIYGNVHGGTILKLIEEAGAIIATRYCNNAAPEKAEPCVAALVRIEHMDFLQPMKIGEVAQLTAEIVFTSAHSLQVEVMVQAEDIIAGGRRKTNRARLWYVPLGKSETVLSVPPMRYSSQEQADRGRLAYEDQKADRERNSMSMKPINPVSHCLDCELETVSYSQTCLSFLVGPNDVTFSKHCRGGVLLKLMDECGGIVSAKHCRSNVVTACLNATNFHKMIKIGSVVTVFGQVTFTSNRSLEVEVIVEFDSPFERNSQRQREPWMHSSLMFQLAIKERPSRFLHSRSRLMKKSKISSWRGTLPKPKAQNAASEVVH